MVVLQLLLVVLQLLLLLVVKHLLLLAVVKALVPSHVAIQIVDVCVQVILHIISLVAALILVLDLAGAVVHITLVVVGLWDALATGLVGSTYNTGGNNAATATGTQQRDVRKPTYYAGDSQAAMWRGNGCYKVRKHDMRTWHNFGTGSSPYCINIEHIVSDTRDQKLRHYVNI